ncbi:MAG: 4a-hydroxytetrahydrobiopterin dehydratase [Candidatus Eremiobacteraeota bacterium]|nr:4a-hydroxytetrahydrobiopterin dehydratase [Candidatus Eremiobacteraeota bacterium]
MSAVTSSLAEKTCVPCSGAVPPLSEQEIAPLLDQLGSDWVVITNHHLSRTYKFKNFKQALAFVVMVGELAEEQRHHPDVYLSWGAVRLEVWTHKIDGLTESDFILAAKCDSLSP